MTVEDLLSGCKRMTACWRFSTRIAPSFSIDCDFDSGSKVVLLIRLFSGSSGPMAGVANVVSVFDFEFDFDLVKENLEVLGRKLDNLVSNSRICYTQSVPVHIFCTYD